MLFIKGLARPVLLYASSRQREVIAQAGPYAQARVKLLPVQQQHQRCWPIRAVVK
jgi:hypothetical protein